MCSSHLPSPQGHTGLAPLHAHDPPDACAYDIAVDRTQHALLFRMDSVIGTYAAHGPPPDRARRGTLCRRPFGPMRPVGQNGRRRPPFHPHRSKQRRTRRGRLRSKPPGRRRHHHHAQCPRLCPSRAAGRVAHARRTNLAPVPTRCRPRRPSHRDCGQEEALLCLLQPRTRLRRLHHVGSVRQMVRGHVWKFQPRLHNVRRSLRGRCARCRP